MNVLKKGGGGGLGDQTDHMNTLQKSPGSAKTQGVQMGKGYTQS